MRPDKEIMDLHEQARQLIKSKPPQTKKIHRIRLLAKTRLSQLAYSESELELDEKPVIEEKP